MKGGLSILKSNVLYVFNSSISLINGCITLLEIHGSRICFSNQTNSSASSAWSTIVRRVCFKWGTRKVKRLSIIQLVIEMIQNWRNYCRTREILGFGSWAKRMRYQLKIKIN